MSLGRRGVLELNGCETCSYVSHKTSDCNIKNVQCFFCQGSHTRAMCNKISKENINENKGETEQSSAGVAICAEANSASSALLPSLSANINSQVAHLLLDSGCQSSFILESIVHEHKLPIIKEGVPLTINGVNSKKNYVSKQVKVPVKIAGQTYEFDCFTLPKIDLSIKVPGTKDLVNLVQSFDCKIADRTLYHVENDRISKFDMIIGISDLAKLKMTNTYLGNTCFWKVNDLTILFGNVNSMISDLTSFKQSVFCNE